MRVIDQRYRDAPKADAAGGVAEVIEAVISVDVAQRGFEMMACLLTHRLGGLAADVMLVQPVQLILHRMHAISAADTRV